MSSILTIPTMEHKYDVTGTCVKGVDPHWSYTFDAIMIHFQAAVSYLATCDIIASLEDEDPDFVAAIRNLFPDDI